MSCLAAPEEQQLEEEDYEYKEELRDDQAAGAMSHPTSQNPIRHAII